MIGAGTVIDKNVKEGSVVYRKSQLIKKDKNAEIDNIGFLFIYELIFR